MKQTMLDLMVKMMPLMKPLIYAAVVLLAIGILATAVRIFSGKGRGWARLAGAILIALGAFFVVSEVAGMLLGAAPSINFGDSTKFEFDLRPFWEIGAAMLIPGILIVMIGGRKRSMPSPQSP